MFPYRLLAAVLAAFLVLSGVYLAGRTHGKAAIQLRWDAQVSEQRQAALEAERAARQVEAERAAAAQKVVNDARIQTARARKDAAAAAAAADGLRDAATAAARRCSGDSPSTERGTADRLADVLSAMDAEGRRVAQAADAAVIAGKACEQAYDSLSR